jgi:S-adenosylmethionine:tRNA ribosyltransferase-isomerase
VLLSDFDFELPQELIAQQPLADRAGSRMLVVNRATGTFSDHKFREFPSQVRFGDCIVLNDTRVFPSRLIGRREGTGGEVEVFLTKRVKCSTWNTLVRPAKRVRVGDHIIFSDELRAEVLERGEFGERVVRLDAKGDLFDVIERIGRVPLPPYIHRDDTEADRERYQTVFARERGSVAAPTAGLHFIPEILEECREAGASVAHVTLHVGLGTFAPLRTEVIEEVRLHHETLHVSNETYAAMDAAKRVVAVGTTSVRAIESPRGVAETDLFISPGFRFERTGAMLTNFHLPKSSLLVLVSAFAGRELILEAYRHAVEQQYRFFSYGDCMLIV